MYLHLLNDREKENFIELAYHIASCDRNFAEQELVELDKFWQETGLSKNEFKIRKPGLDSIIENLSGSSSRNKTTIFLEIMGLALSDLEFNGREQRSISKLREAWNIDDGIYADILRFYEGLEFNWKII